LTEPDGYEHGVPCWVVTWQEDPDTAATFYAGVFGWEVEKGIPPGTDTRYYMCRLRGSDVAAIGSPPRVLRTPDPEGAKAFYGAVLGWTTEAFGPMLLWRLPGYVGGVPEQPVARDVVAVLARAGDGEAAYWRADFWIADADAAAARATQLGGSVVAGPEDAGPFREAVLADPAGATFSVSQLTAGP
jgi:predicted enzyme related to lactoylglutathione lyase